MAVIYITVGALIIVWTGVYFIHLTRIEASENAYLWCAGFFFSGVVLMAVGFAVGHIGRSARQAEVTPTAIIPPVVSASAAPVAPAAQQNGAVAGTPVTAPAPPTVGAAP
jgi:hypothetical protein